MTQNESSLNRLVAAFNEHDLDTLRRACVRGCDFERGDGSPLAADTAFGYLSAFFERCPQARLTAVRMRGFPADQALIEGFVEAPDSSGDCAGGPVRFAAAVRLRFDDNGLIRHAALYIDVESARTQLWHGPRTPGAAAIRSLAERYSRAWSSQDAAGVAACFALEGSQTINGGKPAVGREALAAVAASYMTAFPDLEIRLDELLVDVDRAAFCWTLLGSDSGPGGSGNHVRISGMEVWDLDADGLIAGSRGYYDTDAYARQLARD